MAWDLSVGYSPGTAVRMDLPIGCVMERRSGVEHVGQKLSKDSLLLEHFASRAALEDALKTAVRAAAEAERYAESISYACRFLSADVKSMAISVLIGMQSGRAA
jgi:hypothetical protein